MSFTELIYYKKKKKNSYRRNVKARIMQGIDKSLKRDSRYAGKYEFLMQEQLDWIRYEIQLNHSKIFTVAGAAVKLSAKKILDSRAEKV